MRFSSKYWPFRMLFSRLSLVIFRYFTKKLIVVYRGSNISANPVLENPILCLAMLGGNTFHASNFI